MKWNKKGHGALSAVTAGALALNLAACDQIQSLWKSESPKPAAGIVVQPAPQPVEGKIEVAKSGDSRKAVEPPKVDEDAALAACDPRRFAPRVASDAASTSATAAPSGALG